MAIGKRIPIVFAQATISGDFGASFGETFTDIRNDYAKVKQRRTTRNIGADQVTLTTVYEFSEIRQTASFVPTKDMIIRYAGLDLTIDTIVLNTETVPYYYTIIATENA